MIDLDNPAHFNRFRIVLGVAYVVYSALLWWVYG